MGAMREMKMKEHELEDFIVFEENNDYEGETWRFYITLKGNEDAVSAIEDLIGSVDEYGDYYNISILKKLHRYTIDKTAMAGYMPSASVIDGTLDIGKLKKAAADFTNSAIEDPLYKGGITEFFR